MPIELRKLNTSINVNTTLYYGLHDHREHHMCYVKFGRNSIRGNLHWHFLMFSLTIHFIYHATYAWIKGGLRNTFFLSTSNSKEPAARWDLSREHYLWMNLKKICKCFSWGYGLMVDLVASGLHLDSMVLKVFTILNDSVILWKKKRELKGSFPVSFILSINWYLDSWGIASHCAK